MSITQSLVLLTLHIQVVTAVPLGSRSHQLRRSSPPSKVVATQHHHADIDTTATYLQKTHVDPYDPFTPDPKGESKKQRIMDAISRFRAEICAGMKDEHGRKFATFDACHDFMFEACNPGKDKQMDGDRKEITSGKGYCTEYFPLAQKKAEEQVEAEMEAEAEAKAKAAGEGEDGGASHKGEGEGGGGASPAAATPEGLAPSPATPPEGVEDKGEEGKDAGKGEAPAAASTAAAQETGSAPAASPAGAPAVAAPKEAAKIVEGGKFIPGKTGAAVQDGGPFSKYDGPHASPPGQVPKDQMWYYKKNGQDLKSRMHMSEDMGLPTQGYWGKLVEHEDMETFSGDWQKEWDTDGLKAFCKKHPDSAWCPKRSSSLRPGAMMPLLLTCFVGRIVQAFF